MGQRVITINHKRGNTFEQIVTIPADLSDGHFVGWTPKCELRGADDQPVDEAVCTWVNAITTRELTLKVVDTTAWPLGALLFDVRFTRTSDGFAVSTETARVLVEVAITR